MKHKLALHRTSVASHSTTATSWQSLLHEFREDSLKCHNQKSKDAPVL